MDPPCGSDDQTSLGSILADEGWLRSFLDSRFLLPLRLDDPSGLILLRLGTFPRLDAGSRRPRQIDETAGHPADVFEQFVAFGPDRLGIGLKPVHSRLGLLSLGRQLFL